MKKDDRTARDGGGRGAVAVCLVLLLALAALLSACAGAKSGSAKKSGAGDRVTVSEDEAASFSGTWAGPMETTKFTATMELALPREGAELKAAGKFSLRDLKSDEPITDLKISGRDISFKTVIAGARVHFTGQLDGDKLNGTLVAYQGSSVAGSGTWKLSKS